MGFSPDAAAGRRRRAGADRRGAATDDGVAVVSYNVMPGRACYACACARRWRRSSCARRASREGALSCARRAPARIATEKHDAALALARPRRCSPRIPLSLFHYDLGDIYAPGHRRRLSAAAAAHGLDRSARLRRGDALSRYRRTGRARTAANGWRRRRRDAREGTRFRCSARARGGARAQAPRADASQRPLCLRDADARERARSAHRGGRPPRHRRRVSRLFP